MTDRPAPTADDWAALQASIAAVVFGVFRQGLADPPDADAAEQAVADAATGLAEHRDALRAALDRYLEDFDAEAVWPEVVTHIHAMLMNLSQGLSVVAAHRAGLPELAGTFLGAVDAVCPVWGRLVRNLAGGLMYVVQQEEDPMILRQFVVQAVGISGVRPTPLEDGRLRIDGSPEPAEKLALFFGV